MLALGFGWYKPKANQCKGFRFIQQALFIEKTKPHLLTLDNNVRLGLIILGGFGSYTLGANNIGNVMGVFVSSSPPVSSSQAVVGAVIGIALLQGIKGVKQVKWGVLGGIASGWVTNPIIAAIIGFILLFIVQNVFAQQVYQTIS